MFKKSTILRKKLLFYILECLLMFIKPKETLYLTENAESEKRLFTKPSLSRTIISNDQNNIKKTKNGIFVMKGMDPLEIDIEDPFSKTNIESDSEFVNNEIAKEVNKAVAWKLDNSDTGPRADETATKTEEAEEKTDSTNSSNEESQPDIKFKNHLVFVCRLPKQALLGPRKASLGIIAISKVNQDNEETFLPFGNKGVMVYLNTQNIAEADMTRLSIHYQFFETLNDREEVFKYVLGASPSYGSIARAAEENLGLKGYVTRESFFSTGSYSSKGDGYVRIKIGDTIAYFIRGENGLGNLFVANHKRDADRNVGRCYRVIEEVTENNFFLKVNWTSTPFSADLARVDYLSLVESTVQYVQSLQTPKGEEKKSEGEGKVDQKVEDTGSGGVESAEPTTRGEDGLTQTTSSSEPGDTCESSPVLGGEDTSSCGPGSKVRIIIKIGIFLTVTTVLALIAIAINRTNNSSVNRAKDYIVEI